MRGGVLCECRVIPPYFGGCESRVPVGCRMMFTVGLRSCRMMFHFWGGFGQCSLYIRIVWVVLCLGVGQCSLYIRLVQSE